MKKLISLHLLIVFMTTALITGCAQNKNDRDKVKPNESSLTLILMSDQLWLSYYDTTRSSVSLVLPNELFQVLHAAKEDKGKELNVIIRTSNMVQKATIDTTVEKIRSWGISKYFIIKMSDKEYEKIYTAITTNMKPPEAVVITMPESVNVQKMPEDNAFLIEISKDSSVWYQVISKVSKMIPQKINMPITKNLQKIIAGYENSATDGPKKYLIKGDNKATYPVFEQVINALKANNIYKYNLVTAINE